MLVWTLDPEDLLFVRRGRGLRASAVREVMDAAHGEGLEGDQCLEGARGAGRGGESVDGGGGGGGAFA